MTLTNPDEIQGRSLFEVTPDTPDLLASLRRILTTKAADGQEHSGSFANAPLLGADGSVQFIIHRLKEPREDEARLSTAFTSAPIGMTFLTPDGRITEVNNAYVKMLGYSRDELVSLDSSHFTHPDDIAPTRKLFESLQRKFPATAALEKRYICKDGRLLWARASVTMQRDAQGKPVQVVATIEDITERKQTEARLRESQERLRAMYDGTYEYIGLLSPDGTVLEANRASLEFAGNTREDVLGRPFWDTPWFTPTPGAPEAARGGVARAAAGEFVRYEATLRRPSGEIATFDISLHPVRNEHGEVVLIVPEGRDVTERRAADLRDAFLIRVDDATRRLIDPDKIMESVARLLGEYLRADGCAYCTVETPEDTLAIGWSHTGPCVPNVVASYVISRFGAEGVSLLRANQAFVVADIEKDSRTADARPAYREAGIVSHAAVPLHRAGRLVAFMFVHQQTPRQWLPEEVELLHLVANRCWESIERARVTRALQASERRLRLAQRAGHIGSFEWLIQENRMIWTPELEALYGLAEGSFGRSLQEWSGRLVPEDAGRVIAGIESCLARKQAEYANEFRALLPDGTPRWLRIQAQLFYDPTGTPERMVGVNIDIDARMQAESQLRQQWHTFDTALSNTPDFAYTFDLEGRFTYANRALLSLWQKPLEAAMGKNFFELDYPPELAERLQFQIRQVIDTKETVRDQTPFTGPTGETRIYEYIFVPVLAQGGHVEAVAGTTRDITEQKRAEEQHRQREDQLRESARLESLGVMAGGIAHDFNNLLTGILGNASLLTLDVQSSDHPIANEIMLAAERAADLTKQMLAFAGKGRFYVEALDLNTLIHENLTLLRATLARTVTVDLEIDRQPCFVEADRGQMQQVIMNLLINSSEAMGDRPGRVKVTTALTEYSASRFSPSLQAVVPPGRYVLLEVSDTGTGMTPETMKKIFDPFFTTKFTGRGLGLAAVLGIIRGHRGDIEVTSQPGLGTTFRILLPAFARAGAAGQAATPAAETGAGRTVLLVDDEEIVRSTATAALKSRSFQVIVAANGVEALAALDRHSGISLVILDLTMPVMAGEEALPLIKASYPDIPVILSSGFSEVELSRRFAASGIAGVLQKPYTVSGLIAKIRSALKTIA